MKEKAYYIVSKARQILGGTISADQCRDYVLALLFLKSASEYYKSNNSFQQDDNSPALRLLVSERSSFDYLCKELDSPELGRLINMALYELEQVNALVTEGYEINKAIDFESNILGDMNARSIKLRELLLLFQEIRLTNATGQLIDVGDLYNQLLYIFAEEAGKKINNVLTPTEVVSLITKLIDGDRKNACLCDPASGSGTLLVEVGKKMGIRGTELYGQEVNWNLYALTKMNLMLNGFKGATFLWGDSLSNPKLLDHGGLRKFDIVVSVPPFADKWAAEEAYSDFYKRFKYGIPPKSQVTWAYISHILASLRNDGQAVVVVPVGVLFRNTESMRTQTLFVAARKGYISNKGLCKLSDKMLEQLSNTYKKFLAGEEMGREKKGCSFYIATQDEIRHNKYDLKVIKYVEDKIERKEIDVKVALQRIDELEERLKCIDKQFKDCAWRLRELTKE